MNSTLSQELSTMLSQLLAGERKETWTWLRAEMDPLLDPLAHSICHKLDTQQLTIGTIPRIGMRAGDDWAQLLNTFAQIESTNVIANQPSTSTSSVFESSVQPTVNAQVNNPNAYSKWNGVIAVRLECPQSGCGAVFAREDHLGEHLSAQHLLGSYRCALKDCGQSFDDLKLKSSSMCA